jgi:N-acyl-D-aspartate/D-glutamate deacylase
MPDGQQELAIHEMTGRRAAQFGFEGRGVITPGAHADHTVFDLDALSWENDVMVADLPLGASRLRRPPGGYRWTITGGGVTQAQGERTDASPGHVLRR